MGQNTDKRAAAALLERIDEAPGNLIVLDTASADDLIEGMRLLARSSGQAVYLWTEEAGLCGLRDGGMQVRTSRRLGDALRFIRQSMHFGIYLLKADNLQLTPTVINALLQIGRMRDGPSRRVVLLGARTVVDPRLAAMSLRLRISGGDEARPRLRDGRWVQ